MGIVLYYKEVPKALAEKIENYLPNVDPIIRDYFYDNEVGAREINIDKAWFELDLILRKLEHSEFLLKMVRGSFVILKGVDDDIRYIPSKEVLKITEVFRNYFADEEDLLKAYNSLENDKEFTGDFDEENGEYLLSHYQHLKVFFEDISKSGSAILMHAN